MQRPVSFPTSAPRFRRSGWVKLCDGAKRCKPQRHNKPVGLWGTVCWTQSMTLCCVCERVYANKCGTGYMSALMTLRVLESPSRSGWREPIMNQKAVTREARGPHMIRPDAAQPRRREGTQNEGKDTEGQAPGPPPPPPARQSTPTFHGLDPLLQLPLPLLLQQLLLLLLLHREKDLALLLLLPALLFL